jgi:hypothetical protein
MNIVMSLDEWYAQKEMVKLEKAALETEITSLKGEVSEAKYSLALEQTKVTNITRERDTALQKVASADALYAACHKDMLKHQESSSNWFGEHNKSQALAIERKLRIEQLERQAAGFVLADKEKEATILRKDIAMKQMAETAEKLALDNKALWEARNELEQEVMKLEKNLARRRNKRRK